MILQIEIKQGTIRLILIKSREVIDEISFLDERNLGRKLLPSIDKLLERNKLSSRDIKRVELNSDLSDNFTTQRLAETVKNTLNWALRLPQDAKI